MVSLHVKNHRDRQQSPRNKEGTQSRFLLPASEGVHRHFDLGLQPLEWGLYISGVPATESVVLCCGSFNKLTPKCAVKPAMTPKGYQPVLVAWCSGFRRPSHDTGHVSTGLNPMSESPHEHVPSGDRCPGLSVHLFVLGGFGCFLISEKLFIWEFSFTSILAFYCWGSSPWNLGVCLLW